MSDTFKVFAAKFKALRLRGKPCTEQEVTELEEAVDLSLPVAFRAYLLHSGKVPDAMFTGSSCSYGDLFKLREGAEELLEDNNQPFKLPERAFVFWMHQGYQFAYFVADGKSDNPTVHYYLEGNEKAQQVAESFTQWVEKYVADYQKLKTWR